MQHPVEGGRGLAVEVLGALDGVLFMEGPTARRWPTGYVLVWVLVIIDWCTSW
jgi:hypothetical protein